MKVLIISVFPPETAPEANHALHISEQLANPGLGMPSRAYDNLASETNFCLIFPASAYQSKFSPSLMHTPLLPPPFSRNFVPFQHMRMRFALFLT